MKPSNYWSAIVSTGLITALLLAAALPSIANDSKKQRKQAQSQTPTPTPTQWNKTAGDAEGRFSVGFDATKSPTPERQVYRPGDANDPNTKKEAKKNASAAPAAKPKTEDWLYLNLSPTPTPKPTRSVTHPAKPEKVTGKGKPEADESSSSDTEDQQKKHKKKNKHHHHHDDAQDQGND